MRTFVFGDEGGGSVVKVRERKETFYPVLDELRKLGYHLLYEEE